jgi:hypothetical protein
MEKKIYATSRNKTYPAEHFLQLAKNWTPMFCRAEHPNKCFVPSCFLRALITTKIMKNAKDSKDIKTEIENNRDFWIISSQNNDDPLMIFRKKLQFFSHSLYSKWSLFLFRG